MVFALNATAVPFSKLGILRANREMAVRVLTEFQRDLVVYPGGDLDTWRPWRDRNKVQFGGRTGYARLALRTGSPIVCVAQTDSHRTLMVLSDGQRVAEALRLKKYFRANIFPVHLSFPLGLSVGPTPHLPPPCRLRYRIAPAILPPPLPAGTEPTDEMVAELDLRVRTVMQEQLDGLAESRGTLMGRLARFGRRVSGGAR
jgi:1-acyl-sn-glycerol-3-phosphate acyltransferase